jgi:hypothetical protein
MKYLFTKLIAIAILLAFSSSAFAQQAKEEYFLDTLWTVEVPNFGDKLTAKYPTEAYLSDDRTKIYFNANGPYVMDVATGKYTRLLMLGCNTLHPNTKEFFHSDLYSIFTLPEGNVKKKITQYLATAKYSPNGKYLVGLGGNKFLNEVFVFETENYTLLMKDTLFDISMFYDGEGIYFSPSGNIAMISSRAGDEKNPNGNWYHHIIDIENKKIVKLNRREFSILQILDSNRFAYSFGRNLPANGIYNYITKKVDFEIPNLIDETKYEVTRRYYFNDMLIARYSNPPNYEKKGLLKYTFDNEKFEYNYKTRIVLGDIQFFSGDTIFTTAVLPDQILPLKLYWMFVIQNRITNVENKHDIIILHPNPTDGKLQISNLPKNEIIKCSKINQIGLELSSELINTNDGAISIDISTLPIGTYIININGQNFNASYKVIKGE